MSAAERAAMRQALRLARKGIGGTHPNPRVGAVVLSDGRVTGEGWHARAGEAHAEVRALEAAGGAASHATLVVTLEPCAHQGKTPPCVGAILAAGVRRVVVGMVDPNPIVNGRGIAALRNAGLDVAVGVLEHECAALNEPYVKALATGLPRVTLKAMLSLDGRMATDEGDSRGLGGAEEQRLCHRLRAEHDAVLIGSGTLRADDPILTVRLVRGRSPWRVVLDSRLSIADGAAILGSAAKSPLVVATVSRDAARAAALESRGARVWRFEPGPDGRVPLRPLLERLVREGRFALLVEGGSAVHTSFLREGLADRVAIGIAPILLGGREPRAWTGDLGRRRLGDAIAVEELRARRVGRDVWLEGALRRAEPAPGERGV
ncbi:MAG TPA: bifunctional diaminohydroxyphosphoribosylaminopyrimidine deaminase/5-amino-6-(5-phosphoribosylamino)uracil reductase RibD [Candidatus Eisenbacteria bacterium]|nr:bifunctional diaminohydroxyphosphoribosylaminopyrimidine deaminase/5-amino-6-(5-phosphoribosylamino)uracil reductase RibD [Candidatus Eisenbacteria bacterium]